MKRKTARRWAAAGVLAAVCHAAAILVPRQWAARNAAATTMAPAAAEALEDATCFTFTDDAIAVTAAAGPGYTVEGTTLTISAAGTYQVSGQCADGAIQIKKGVTGVTLVLAGLDLTSTDTAPLCCGKNSGVTILAAGGTENSLTDATQNNDDTAPENANAENAVLKCKAGSQVVLGGSGTLTVTSHGKHGIFSGSATDEQDASLTVRALTLQIKTEIGDAIHAGQTLTIESGNLTLTATDDALHSDGALTITGGTVLAAGGSGSMGMQLTTEQPYLLQQSGAAIVAGETLSIADADGTNILDACQAPCTISFLFYTSPDLTGGQSYTLQGAGSASVQLEAQTGTLQGGMMPGGPAGGLGADVGRLDAQPPGGQGGAPAAHADGAPSGSLPDAASGVTST